MVTIQEMFISDFLENQNLKKIREIFPVNLSYEKGIIMCSVLIYNFDVYHFI